MVRLGIVWNHLLKVLFPQIFLLLLRKILKILDQQLVEPHQFTLLCLFRPHKVGKSIEEVSLEVCDHLRRDVPIALFEKQTEKQALCHSFLVEDDLEPLHVVGDERD